MPRPATARSAVYEPPEIAKATVLRPDVVARLELLRIVWRPDRSAAMAIEAAKELEIYLSSKAPE